MKRSHDSYIGSFAQPSVSPKRQACEAVDSCMAPYTEPSFLSVEVEDGVARQDAVNHLACANFGLPSLPIEHFSVPSNCSLDSSLPALNVSFPYQSPSPAHSFDSIDDMTSDRALEFEIQSEMGMVWQEDESAFAPPQTTPDFPPADTGFLPDPTWFNSWQDQTVNMIGFPTGPAPVMIPNFAQHPSQLPQAPQPTPLRPRAAETLRVYGDDLQAHARKEAQVVQKELAHITAGARTARLASSGYTARRKSQQALNLPRCGTMNGL